MGLLNKRKHEHTCMTQFLFIGSWIPLMLFLSWFSLYLFTDPSCLPVSEEDERIQGNHLEAQLRAIVVADLHLSGPTTAWLDRLLRETFMKTAFQRAYKLVKPQALLVLGDISDWGRKSTDEQWRSVVHRFNDVAKPYLDLPYHVSVGNHDIGDFYQITPGLIRRFASSFPGLDETGSSTFVIRNVTFVSLNAMALACDVCPMHLSMQRVVEDVKRKLQTSSIVKEPYTASDGGGGNEQELHGPEKPILLLHLPLFRADEGVCNRIDIPRCAPWHELEGDCLALFARRLRPPKLTAYRSRMDMLSLSTSRSLLWTLQPSLVLSAHAHHFCDRRFDGGTREVTASTFTGRNRDDPSFLLLYVYKDGSQSIHQCFLPRESLVIMLHILRGIAILALLIASTVFCCVNKRKSRSKVMKKL